MGGLFGIFNTPENISPAQTVFFGLHALQHRGQDGCGIAVNDDGTIVYHKDLGMVSTVFNDTVIANLGGGKTAIGQVRSADEKSNTRENTQPLVTKYHKGTLSIIMNGNVINSDKLRAELEDAGVMFQTTSDAELIANLVSRERLSSSSIDEALQKAMKKIHGGYAIVIMSPSKLIAARDPHGYRPLVIGELDGSTIFTSETVACDAVGAKVVRDVLPGEVVVVNRDGLQPYRDNCGNQSKICVFEYMYFARPDSVIEDESVYEVRKRAGELLAADSPVAADLVIGVPDSGISAAIGYSEKSGIPYGAGLIKNKYVAREFVSAVKGDTIRIKLNALKSAVNGKRVIMVDDSIIRGASGRYIVQLLRNAGAKEVHVRVASPKFLYECNYGTVFPPMDTYAAQKYTDEEFVKEIGADSLAFLGLDRLEQIKPGGFCDGCFSGKYI